MKKRRGDGVTTPKGRSVLSLSLPSLFLTLKSLSDKSFLSCSFSGHARLDFPLKSDQDEERVRRAR